MAEGNEIVVRMDKWQKIRSQFSQGEKDALNKARCGDVICPPMLIVDRSKLSDELGSKLWNLLDVPCQF